MPLYTQIILLSLALPLALSFDKILGFYRMWKYIFPSIAIVALLFIIPDILLTKAGVWGFNQQYHSNLLIYKLPIEEILFFIVIPYCCLFTHYALFAWFPKAHVNTKTGTFITAILLAFSLLMLTLYNDKTYTTYILGLLIVVVIISYSAHKLPLFKFYTSFLLMLIPFVIVNGILTGTFIENEVVWYNNTEQIGKRFLTIPVEDFAYAFTLILMNLFLTERFMANSLKRKLRKHNE